ncbi:MAG: HAD family phosphatase [Planktomarina sp.]|nr:HAD family phosphatase [Planktomarina sp.]MDT2032521.1 HAD family phosphatase [Planktomarina sp.]MDT2048820.1 HAD family phosphatase [Planktomarina sp.]|tara:strand:- start:23425 stop:24045 length:621 start_codon:yes stop_codon:yes gene_type:complete
MNVKAVVFDIGNVLIEWHPERYFDRTIGPAKRRALFAAVDLHAMNDRIDLGEGFRDVIYAVAEANPEWRTEIRDWHDNWIQLATPPIAHSVRLLRALRSNEVAVFSLTNFGVESFAYAQSHYDFLKEFDRDYVSGQMQVIKPDPKIYTMLEQDCGVAPENLLFTDDRADNIAVAANRGWQTHLFEGPQGWADRLVEANLLSVDQSR